MESKHSGGDTIDSVGDKGDDLGAINGQDVPAYKVPSNVVDIAKPQKSYVTRIAHSFRRREDTIQLNSKGQQVLDPEKYGEGEVITSHDTSRLDRKLKGRHMQMIAIGGAIGTGIIHINVSYL